MKADKIAEEIKKRIATLEEKIEESYGKVDNGKRDEMIRESCKLEAMLIAYKNN